MKVQFKVVHPHKSDSRHALIFFLSVPMQEWEEDRRAELLCTMRETMKRVVIRCHAKDAEFWPPAVSRAAGFAQLPPGHSSLDDDHFGLLDAQPKVGEVNVVKQKMDVCDEAACPRDAESSAAGRALASQHPMSLNTASSTQRSAATVEYITWSDAWEHVTQSLYQAIHLMSSAITTRSIGLPWVQAVLEYGFWMGREATTQADAIRDRCRESLPWPEMQMRRCSALRCAVDWHGFSRPVLEMHRENAGWKSAPLELDLSRL